MRNILVVLVTLLMVFGLSASVMAAETTGSSTLKWNPAHTVARFNCSVDTVAGETATSGSDGYDRTTIEIPEQYRGGVIYVWYYNAGTDGTQAIEHIAKLGFMGGLGFAYIATDSVTIEDDNDTEATWEKVCLNSAATNPVEDNVEVGQSILGAGGADSTNIHSASVIEPYSHVQICSYGEADQPDDESMVYYVISFVKPMMLGRFGIQD